MNTKGNLSRIIKGENIEPESILNCQRSERRIIIIKETAKDSMDLSVKHLEENCNIRAGKANHYVEFCHS